MKLSSRYQYNVLCEDAQTRSFVVEMMFEWKNIRKLT